MGSLRARLTRLKSYSNMTPTQKTIPKCVDSELIDGVPHGKDPDRRVALSWGPQSLNCRLEHNEWGEFIIRRQRYSEDHTHGHYSLHLFLHLSHALSALLPDEEVSYNQLLFFDMETTGLGVGTGNVPFMIGLGFYEGEQFVIEQLLIRNPAEELAMLAHVMKRLQEYPIIVSYNGKSFDWPLLKNRLILNRMEWQSEDPLHLDFLYPARNLWRTVLSSCSLDNVESERLGIKRINDIPGAHIPLRYFHFLADQDPDLLIDVFKHNELDILSLLSLGMYVAKSLSGALRLEKLQCEELFRLGNWLERIGKESEATQVFEALLSRTLEDYVSYLSRLAMIYKRRGDWERAVDLWEKKINMSSHKIAFEVEPLIELAKYYEHHAKDYFKALQYAEEAYQCVWQRLTVTRRGERERKQHEEINHRIKRLHKKIKNLNGTEEEGYLLMNN